MTPADLAAAARALTGSPCRRCLVTTFTVHPVRCPTCQGKGLVLVPDPGSYDGEERRCRAEGCVGGVKAWEVRKHVAGQVLITVGTLPARAFDHETAEALAGCLDAVPGREVEAVEHFAQTGDYPDYLIAAMGAALTGGGK